MSLICNPIQVQTSAVVGELSVSTAVGSLLQSLSRCCCVPLCVIMRDAVRAGCCVRYMARHVVGHTMQSFHTWRILYGQCSPECGDLVGVVVWAPVWCSHGMDLAADQWIRMFCWLGICSFCWEYSCPNGEVKGVDSINPLSLNFLHSNLLSFEFHKAKMCLTWLLL